jgi:ABC-2 type transport system ATP-binding protein
MNSSVLHIENLQTRRGADFVLQLEQLELRNGTVLCIIGPNGSGKTTLIEHIAGLTLPDTGSLQIHGQEITNNLYTVRANIGFIPDDDEWFIPELNAREYFAALQRIYQKARPGHDFQSRCDSLAQQLSFTSYDTQISKLSHGNKKKIQIIAGLMHEPEIIVIDELRNGLDPFAIMASEKIVKDEAARGACIVVSTHDLWWAERLASEVLLLSHGKVILHKTVQAAVQDFGSLEQAFLHKVGQPGRGQ